MRNLLVTIRYDGSMYHGWPVQQNAVTVQSTVQDALERILGRRENIVGCSRTDAGVHANMFCFNMRTESPVSEEKLLSALNALLPREIAAYACREVDYDFHARYSCKSKEYQYILLNSKFRNPFYEKKAYYYKYNVDAALLDAEAKALLGTHDFTSFCAAGSSTESKVRTMKRADVCRDGDIVKFIFEADGFLYNMVRITVGTLLDLNSGKLARGSISEILEKKDRAAAGVTAPGCGLYLNQVNY